MEANMKTIEEVFLAKMEEIIEKFEWALADPARPETPRGYLQAQLHFCSFVELIGIDQVIYSWEEDNFRSKLCIHRSMTLNELLDRMKTYQSAYANRVIIKPVLDEIEHQKNLAKMGQ